MNWVAKDACECLWVLSRFCVGSVYFSFLMSSSFAVAVVVS